MAKLGKILRNKEKQKLVDKYAAKRAALKAIIKSVKSTDDERADAYTKLRALPRDSSATRVTNRCVVSGRPRAYIRKFGMSRLAFREAALRGDLPGVTKSSW